MGDPRSHGLVPTTPFEATSGLLDTVICDLSKIKLPENVDPEDDVADICRERLQTPEWRQFRDAAVSLTTPGRPPVAFPTETVYGLGADATNDLAVHGIFNAKNRPSDNPLIVHVASLPQLRQFLGDVPEIYEPLIKRFWPGALTIILRLPEPSPFAPSVTNSLGTVGIRMPSTPMARLLISIAGKPLAAPSANTSTKPSPTTAQHVFNDMQGKIRYIIDGGPCEVGLESTVVDGLSDPPLILRPGGVSLEAIKSCGGKWADVRLGYSDKQLTHGQVPRAPGMKYKHYAPAGKVLLFEAGIPQRDAATKLWDNLRRARATGSPQHRHTLSFAVVTTASWDPFLGIRERESPRDVRERTLSNTQGTTAPGSVSAEVGEELAIAIKTDWPELEPGTFYNIDAGRSAEDVAKKIFAALRALDKLGCQIIIIEGISEASGDLAAAVMNRLRKAAENE